MAKFTSIEKFVDEYGDDMLPIKTKSGKVFMPVLADIICMLAKPVPLMHTDARNAEYRDFGNYMLLGADIIETYEHGPKCKHCGGGTVRVTLRKKTGEVVATYEVYTG